MNYKRFFWTCTIPISVDFGEIISEDFIETTLNRETIVNNTKILRIENDTYRLSIYVS